MEKEILGTINVSDKRFIEKACDIAIDYFPIESRDILIAFSSILCNELRNELEVTEEGITSYTAGHWRVFIKTLPSNKVTLAVYYKQALRVQRTFDTLYKAYLYAFNILAN